MAEAERVNLSPTHPDTLARLLANGSGRDITPEMVAADIEEGAPVDGNGLMRLDQYLAWLAKVTNGRT